MHTIPLITRQFPGFAKSVNPQPGDVYVAQPALQFVVAHFQQSGGLHEMFPSVPMDLQSGVYFTVDRSDSMRVQTALKSPTGAIPQIGVGVNHSGTYNCDVYMAEFPMSAQLAANYQVPLARDQFLARTLGRAAYLNRELRWITDFFSTGKWATDVTPATTWNDPASDPIGDIETGIETVLNATGRRPNVLGVGYQVWKALKQHPDILQRIGTGSASNVDPRMVTPRLVAALFGLEEIRVGEVVYNSANAGASASMAFAAGKNALLAYRTPTPSLLEHSAGYMFTWRTLAGNDMGLALRMGVDERTMEQWSQILHAEDFKIVDSASGYFFSNCVA